MRKQVLETLVVLLSILALAGCPQPADDSSEGDHPIVGDWYLRYQNNGQWLPYLHYRFEDDGTFCQIGNSSNACGSYIVLDSDTIQATYRISLFVYTLTINVTGDSASGTFQQVTLGTTTSLEGFRAGSYVKASEGVDAFFDTESDLSIVNEEESAMLPLYIDAYAF